MIHPIPPIDIGSLSIGMGGTPGSTCRFLRELMAKVNETVRWANELEKRLQKEFDLTQSRLNDVRHQLQSITGIQK